MDIKMIQDQRKRCQKGKFQSTLSVIMLQSTSSGRNSKITVSLTHLKINVISDDKHLRAKGMSKDSTVNFMIASVLTNQVIR